MLDSGIKYSLYGSLLGTAVGDAYGLPFEGILPRRLAKLFAKDDHYHLIPFINGAMVSDDTEHAVMTVQAFIHSGGNIDKFRQSLKWRLVVWLIALPAGIGLATGRAIFKIMLGCRETGVFSAGNGVAMRASVLGVVCQDIKQLKNFIHISTVMTHTDPKAEQGALVVALLAWIECYHSHWTVEQAIAFLATHLDDEVMVLIHHQADYPKGITGYIYDTVPAVVQAWQRYRERPMDGLNFLIQQGGDTDTVAAIFGGIVGVRYGKQMFEAMSGTWCEPVLRPSFFMTLAQQAEQVYQTREPAKPIGFAGLRTVLRNIFFFIIVLLHGFRRLLLPY